MEWVTRPKPRQLIRIADHNRVDRRKGEYQTDKRKVVAAMRERGEHGRAVVDAVEIGGKSHV